MNLVLQGSVKQLLVKASASLHYDSVRFDITIQLERFNDFANDVNCLKYCKKLATKLLRSLALHYFDSAAVESLAVHDCSCY